MLVQERRKEEERKKKKKKVTAGVERRDKTFVKFQFQERRVGESEDL